MEYKEKKMDLLINKENPDIFNVEDLITIFNFIQGEEFKLEEKSEIKKYKIKTSSNNVNDGINRMIGFAQRFIKIQNRKSKWIFNDPEHSKRIDSLRNDFKDIIDFFTEYLKMNISFHSERSVRYEKLNLYFFKELMINNNFDKYLEFLIYLKNKRIEYIVFKRLFEDYSVTQPSELFYFHSDSSKCFAYQNFEGQIDYKKIHVTTPSNWSLMGIRNNDDSVTRIIIFNCENPYSLSTKGLLVPNNLEYRKKRN